MYDLEYYIYHSGYGPTNETLGKFIRELFGQTAPHMAEDTHVKTIILERTARLNGPRQKNETRSPPKPSKLGLIQTAGSADPDANLKKTLRARGRAAQRGAQIICTQELFRSQYFCQSEDHKNFKLAEPSPVPPPTPLQARQKTQGRRYCIAL